MAIVPVGIDLAKNVLRYTAWVSPTNPNSYAQRCHMPNDWFGFAARTTYAASSMNSTLTASNGNSTPPFAARLRTPASNNAFTSPCTAFTSRPTRLAASRMDMAPAPHIALSNSHRLAVSTCHSNSGVAKPMRASRSARPDFIARDASASVSARERTSRTTVFMIPPRNVSIEVKHQLIRRRKRIKKLFLSKMPMITFASLVVVPEHTLATNDISESVLERMLRRRDWLWDSPNGNLCECVGS